MTFTESNTIEAYLRDLLTGGITDQPIAPVGLAQQGIGWHFLPSTALGRHPQPLLPSFLDNSNQNGTVPSKTNYETRERSEKESAHRQPLPFRVFRAFRSCKPSD